MTTPLHLAAVLAQRPAVAHVPAATLALSERYFAGVGEGNPALRTALDREAYVAARMPATSAAVARALMLSAGPWLDDVGSVLDLGSGPGSALWAVQETCDATTFTAFERDPGLIALGKILASAGPDPLPQTTWITGDLRTPPAFAQHDLVVISYAGNELDAASRHQLMMLAWSLARVAVLIVEPGSRSGAQQITAAREYCINAGGTIIAPCTHQHTCPLADTSDWCHQRVRLARSRQHRLAKTGSRGFEDEPFAFVCAVKTAAAAPTRSAGRIIGSPQTTAAAVDLPLCTASGYGPLTIARRDPAYKQAKRARWGDTWPPAAAGPADDESFPESASRADSADVK